MTLTNQKNYSYHLYLLVLLFSILTIANEQNRILVKNTDKVNKTNILNLLDYSHTRVKEGTTFDLLNEIEEESKNDINFESEIKPILDRAHDILTGKIVFDPRREFSTKPGSKNLIRRHGELKDFMLNYIKMIWAGTNKQATGIFGHSGEKFIIRVEADEKDPLPKAKFSQHIASFNSWHSQDFDLKLGENEFTFPTFTEYTAPIGGGPFYLTNPYFEEEQSENVKVYIEGGVTFPLFRRDGDEKEFMTFLKEYANLVKTEPKKYLDLMEIEGIRILHTMDAVRGYNIYSQGKSPQASIVRWDDYLKLLFKFDGIQYEKTEPHYERRSEYMNLNIRHMNPFGEAYAANEHVGVAYDDWLDRAIYAESLQVMHWGYAHEIGHTMEIPDRTIGEISNNMESKYDETVIRREGTRGEYESTLRCLTPDGIDDDKRGDGEKPFFQAVALNFLVWWQIESLYPGYWGKLDNLYRYSFPDSIPTRTERMIYLSSVVTKLNMSYYFSRWGFSLEDSKETFKYWKSSAKFQNLMNDLLDKKNITNDVIRFWYLDGHNYNYIADKGTGCYKTKKDKINISDVLKVEGGYSVILPKSTCEGHLGYEIMESEKEIVIGFAYGTIYADKKTYPEGYTPVYKIRAYDRYLDRNDVSDQKSPIGGKKVCSINGVFYDSLASAIGSIPQTDKETEVILHKDTYEGKVIVNRNIKLVLSDKVDKSLTIYKTIDGCIFSIEKNIMMKISGRDKSVNIIIDGNGFSQEGALIDVNGRLEGRFLTLRNNINTKTGGAIQSLDGNTTLIDSIVENNKAEMAGGVSISNPQCKGLFSNVIFRSNNANGNYGALFNKGTITVKDCKFESNSANNNGGAISNDMGGILYLYTTEIVNNEVKENGGGLLLNGLSILHGNNIHNNTAKFGGGIFINGENDARKVFIDQKTVIESNSAVNGGGVYIQNGFVNYLKVSIFKNKASSDGSNTYVNNGNEKQSLTIEGDKSPMLEGEIFKIRKANIVIKAKMFSLYDQKSPIIIDFPAQETENNENGEIITLFKADSYSFNDNDLKLLRVQGKEGVMTLNSEKNEIIFKIS